MKIVVDIERLVLDNLGGTPVAAARIRKALERELAKTLSAHPATRYNSSVVPRLKAPAVRLTAGEKPEATGGRIGQAIGQSLVASAAESGDG